MSQITAKEFILERDPDTGKPVRRKYQFQIIGVGEYAALGELSTVEVQRIRSAAIQYAKSNPGVKFSILNNPMGYQVWRAK